MEDQRRKALVIDDEDSIRYVFRAYLTQLGYACESASNGRDGLDKMAVHDFSVVLLDLRMPGLSGFDVLKKIRAQDVKTCIVVLTAIADVEVATHALELGADDFLTKPCDLGLLETRLTAAVDKRINLAQPDRIPKRSALAEPSYEGHAKLALDLVQQQLNAFGKTIEGDR